MNEKKSQSPENITLYYGDRRPTIFTMKGELGRLFKTNKRLEFKGEDVSLDLSTTTESKLVSKRIRPLDYLIQWAIITTLVVINTGITGANSSIAPVYGLLALPLIFLITRLGNRVVKVVYKDKGIEKEAYFSNFRGMSYDRFRDYIERNTK